MSGLSSSAKWFGVRGDRYTPALLRVVKSVLATAASLVLVASLASGSAEASENQWIIKRVSGVVYFVAPGIQAYRVKKGMVFQKGYTLATRPGGRALVARGVETISVGPNSKFALSKHRSRGGNTTLLQDKGTLEVDVQKRARPHFTVETPFLAAVVKGTRFRVSIRGKEATVSVSRGRVEVEDFASGDRVDLTNGQSAASAPEKAVGLTVTGPSKPEIRSGKRRAPAFQTPPVKNIPDDVQSNSSQVTGSGAQSNGRGLFGGLFSGGNGNGNSNGNGNGNSGGNGNGNGNGNGRGNN